MRKRARNLGDLPRVMEGGGVTTEASPELVELQILWARMLKT